MPMADSLSPRGEGRGEGPGFARRSIEANSALRACRQARCFTADTRPEPHARTFARACDFRHAVAALQRYIVSDFYPSEDPPHDQAVRCRAGLAAAGRMRSGPGLSASRGTG